MSRLCYVLPFLFLCGPALTETCQVAGDSIAKGTGTRGGMSSTCLVNATPGIRAEAIVARVRPTHVRFSVISAGSNNPVHSWVEFGTLKGTLEHIRSRVPQYAIWILPATKLQRAAVQQVAHRHRDPTVTFRANKTGHPVDYRAVAASVHAKMQQINARASRRR